MSGVHGHGGYQLCRWVAGVLKGLERDPGPHLIVTPASLVAGVLKGLERDPGPHLIVTPASLLENWQRELRRWAPGLRVQPYFGRERQAVRAELTSWRCGAVQCALRFIQGPRSSECRWVNMAK